MELLSPANPRSTHPRLLEPREHLGRPVRLRSLDGLHVFEAQTPPGHTAQLALPAAQLLFVLEGRYTARLGETERERTEGALFFQPADLTLAERHPEGTRRLVIEAEPAWIARHLGAVELPDGPVDVVEGAAPNAARLLYAELLAEDELALPAIEALAQQLFVALLRSAARSRHGGSDWPHGVDRILRQHYVAPPSVDEIARSMGLHPGSLSRAYRRTFGRTIRERIRELRVEEACRQLERDEATLAEIARAAGFSDQSHFGRVFRQTLGLTPARYRARVRTGATSTA